MGNIAIITARGGSKRVPLKNIRSFHGIPIIGYGIKAAKACGLFDEVMVSTDSEEIAEVSRSFGANIPFMRSQKNSDDISTTAEVVREVLEWYWKNGKRFKYACCIYPTAAFITPPKLNQAYELLNKESADSVLPVVKFGFSIWRSFKMEDNYAVEYNWPEFAQKRSQDLPATFHDSGQFYFFNVQRFFETGTLIMKNTRAIEVSDMEAQDIDTEGDWRLAETKYALFVNNNLRTK